MLNHLLITMHQPGLLTVETNSSSDSRVGNKNDICYRWALSIKGASADLLKKKKSAQKNRMRGYFFIINLDLFLFFSWKA